MYSRIYGLLEIVIYKYPPIRFEIIEDWWGSGRNRLAHKQMLEE